MSSFVQLKIAGSGWHRKPRTLNVQMATPFLTGKIRWIMPTSVIQCYCGCCVTWQAWTWFQLRGLLIGLCPEYRCVIIRPCLLGFMWTALANGARSVTLCSSLKAEGSGLDSSMVLRSLAWKTWRNQYFSMFFLKKTALLLIWSKIQ